MGDTEHTPLCAFFSDDPCDCPASRHDDPELTEAREAALREVADFFDSPSHMLPEAAGTQEIARRVASVIRRRFALTSDSEAENV